MPHLNILNTTTLQRTTSQSHIQPVAESRQAVLFVVPLPPPMAGVEQISNLLFQSNINKEFDVHILKSNVRDSNATKGRWDWAGARRVIRLCGELIYRILSVRPAIVYLTLSQNGAGVARDCAYLMICWFFGISVVAHCHGSKLSDFIRSRNPLVRKMLITALRIPKKIIVCAHSIKGDLVPYLGENKISVLYNAVPNRQNALVKNQTESPGGMFNVFFMGHLSVAKGFYDLIQAAEKLLAKNPYFHFTFAGERLDNEKNIHLNQDLSKSGKSRWNEVDRIIMKYPNRLNFPGIVTKNEKEKIFQSTDLFVLPSYAEAFPVSVLEAMEYGIPLVVTPVGALPEVLIEGENCLFIKPGNINELSNAIYQIKRDYDLRARMNRLNKKVVENFREDRFVKTMEKIFKDITDERNQRN